MHNENVHTDDESNNNIIPIGKEVIIFRTLLNCTQQKFADLLLASRVTVSKLEQLNDSEELTTDIALRLFYLTQKIINNKYKEDYVIRQAKILQGRIDELLMKRISEQ